MQGSVTYEEKIKNNTHVWTIHVHLFGNDFHALNSIGNRGARLPLLTHFLFCFFFVIVVVVANGLLKNGVSASSKGRHAFSFLFNNCWCCCWCFFIKLLNKGYAAIQMGMLDVRLGWRWQKSNKKTTKNNNNNTVTTTNLTDRRTCD